MGTDMDMDTGLGMGMGMETTKVLSLIVNVLEEYRKPSTV
jgi:hypothetical protein